MYIGIGFLALGIGAIGVVLPILPTTPLLLLASFCFLKGSTKVNEWFKTTQLYQKHLEQFITHKAMTSKQKTIILVCSETMILIPAIVVDNLIMRIVIGIIMIGKLYYFIFKIKTIPSHKANN